MHPMRRRHAHCRSGQHSQRRARALEFAHARGLVHRTSSWTTSRSPADPPPFRILEHQGPAGFSCRDRFGAEDRPGNCDWNTALHGARASRRRCRARPPGRSLRARLRCLRDDRGRAALCRFGRIAHSCHIVDVPPPIVTQTSRCPRGPGRARTNVVSKRTPTIGQPVHVRSSRCSTTSSRRIPVARGRWSKREAPMIAVLPFVVVTAAAGDRSLRRWPDRRRHHRSSPIDQTHCASSRANQRCA